MKYLHISRFKYELAEDALYHTPIRPPAIISLWGPDRMDVTLDPSGMLAVYRGFKWDGASGPTLDDCTNQEPALKHDALYYLMAEGLLDRKWRKPVDQLFYRDLLKAGMPKWRAWYWYTGVRWFGRKSASTPHERYKVYAC